ncbi:glycosyltransferase [Flavobacterium caseinilyticum]|uniref:Glycosyltransferase n=1 Tax=Flavobacterium caseinilyticum TaxID=2541732 RepID=A0A4R5AVG2_9FLAO|nr:glycosyltransferase [Flavobacterium caseinilyticum]TDD75929.1 glycosyltransferase [Flavobacterium caseinilyticum]
MNSQLISIVIPVYNVEEFFHQCVNSIISQSYTNIEIILVDDGSTDTSGKLCDEYSKLDSRIKVIHQKNAGLSAARNKGLELVTGDYIWFVDSDDWIAEDALKILNFELKKSKAEIVTFSNFQYIETSKTTKDNFINKKSELIDGKTFITSGYKLEIAPWIYVYQRDFLVKNNISFREDIKIHEDEFFLLDCFSKVNKIICIEDRLYYHRIRANSLMRSNRIDDKVYSFSEAISLCVANKKKYLFNDFWSKKQFHYQLMFYSLYFKNNVANSKQLFNKVKKIKVDYLSDDNMKLRLLKIIHNNSFSLFKYYILRN